MGFQICAAGGPLLFQQKRLGPVRRTPCALRRDRASRRFYEKVKDLSPFLPYLKMHSHTVYLSFCIFLNAYSYNERPAKFAGQERQHWPVQTGQFGRSGPAIMQLSPHFPLSLDREIELVEVRLP